LERFDALMEGLLPIARRAGKAILDVCGGAFVVLGKEDGSPLTEADMRSEAIILAGLANLSPGVPVISEEAASAGGTPAVGAKFWLVDPLDGTKEFVSRNGEFTVNIALVESGVSKVGIVLAPALGRVWAGAIGHGAFLEDAEGRRHISVASPGDDGLIVVSSRSHGDAQALERFLAGRKVAASVTAGSSLKFCLVASGEADVYPRFGPTMEWDTAAGHAVLAAAGGRVTDLDGRDLAYGKAGFRNPGFVAWGQTQPGT
jgi:3'(2'), 5'-bisphosphate nucleotidase